MTSLRDRADAAAQVLVDDVAAPELGDGDAHHLLRVLRLRDGEVVIAGDGEGAWRRCEMAHGTLAPSGPVVREERPAPVLSVWLPALKGDRAEWAVQKLTELGVDEIGLVRAARASVRLDDATAARVLGRWARVAREAACQSRRVFLPRLSGPLDVAALALAGVRRCDLDGRESPVGALGLAVGPEGGWADEERPDPVEAVGLADAVLRTETAAVAAGAALVAARRTARHAAAADAP